MSEHWYAPASQDAPLDQGDIIFDCPVVSWKDHVLIAQDDGMTDALKGEIELAKEDVVVMTQTCDLAQGKIHYVILCPHCSLSEYREDWERIQEKRDQNPTDRSWAKHMTDIAAGQIWNRSMLNSEEGEEHNMDHRIVDFHEVFSLPRSFLESWILAENPERLRLRPPYREHLSQAFARFFMRVGLPTEIVQCW